MSNVGYYSCPKTHQYAYGTGRRCCKYGKEKVDPRFASCDGGPISWHSICCFNDDSVSCPEMQPNDRSTCRDYDMYADIQGIHIQITLLIVSFYPFVQVPIFNTIFYLC